MKTFFRIFVLFVICVMLIVGCTENERVKKMGGKATIDLPVGQKLVNVTWKDKSIWYLTRPMRAGEVPEEYSFHEQSNFGLLEGTVVIKEKGVEKTK